MTKDEALRLALEYVELVPDDRYNAEHIDQDALITAIKSALEAKVEPVVWNEGVPAMLPKQKEGETFIVSYEPKLEAKDEPAPVAKNEEGRITWMIDDWPQNCLLYTHPPQSFTYEQVKAHIRAASMSANDISVGSDTTEDGVSIVIRRRDELLYAEFFAYTQPQRKPLTDEQAMDAYFETPPFGTYKEAFIAGIRFIEAAHGIKGEA